jgi:hypothetical protein
MGEARIKIIANSESRVLTGVKMDDIRTFPSALHRLRGERSLPHGHRGRLLRSLRGRGRTTRGNGGSLDSPLGWACRRSTANGIRPEYVGARAFVM